ncbi:restriction endonuclease subunit S [Vibrio metschnikovii]|uniref:restriction endonuclease subunit S n=1 Tax=Vibrio metschnikovii TaxID=28172 RepID=UPI001C306335|nr:restriction endonuclease subunit S [Vibrio metschnikovii]MDA3140063.1 restriction endonuclease subunit S [Vibrio metschnikovii]
MSFDNLPCGWKLVTLEDAMDAIIDYRGKTPKKTESGIPLITAKIVKGGYVLEPFEFIAEDNYDSWMVRGLPQVGDVVLTTEAPLGETAQLTSSNVALAQRIVTLRGKKGLLDNDFLLCALQSDFVQHQLESRASGSTVKGIKQSELRKVSLPIPPLHQQKKISQVLKSLSNKLVCNTQTNQILEQMAQAIFKSWFVDFDPVKAKMNGGQPEGMDGATASLFPEKLDSETGIPVGWSQGIIEDIAKLNAKSWTKKNQPEQVHYVDLANTKNGVIETVTTYDFDEAPSRARRVLNSGDTIVGTVRPGNRSFAFIGETEQPLTGSTGFAVLSPKEEFWTSFVYLATTNDDAIDEYARLADGGAYPAIKPVVVADTPCVIPTTDIAQKFWQLTGAMLKKAHQNRLENEELAKLRDTLLPKLLSGEIELGTTEVMEPQLLVASPTEQYL